MLMALIGWTKAATAAIGCGHAALLGNVPLGCKGTYDLLCSHLDGLWLKYVMESNSMLSLNASWNRTLYHM
jgi:hypothetical protein